MKKIIRRTYSSYESFAEMQESEGELKAKKKRKYIKIAAAAGLAVGAGAGIYHLDKTRKNNKALLQAKKDKDLLDAFKRKKDKSKSTTDYNNPKKDTIIKAF